MSITLYSKHKRILLSRMGNIFVTDLRDTKTAFIEGIN